MSANSPVGAPSVESALASIVSALDSIAVSQDAISGADTVAVLDEVTPGTAAASKALIVGASVEIAGIGALAAASVAVGDGTAAAPTVLITSDPDTGLYSSAANVLGFTAGGTSKATLGAGGLVLTPLANGQATNIKQATAQSTALTSGSTYTFTNLIPAGSIVLGVTVRVTTLITGATSLSIGDGTDADRWGASIGVIKDTVTTLANATITSVPLYAAQTSVVITPAGGDFTAGVIRATVHYISLTGATS